MLFLLLFKTLQMYGVSLARQNTIF